MPGWVLLGATSIGFKGGVSILRDASTRSYRQSVIYWVIGSLAFVLLIHHLTADSMRFWWMVAGLLLSITVGRMIFRATRQSPPWVEPLEGVGLSLALWLGTQDLITILVGIIIGFLLAVAIGHGLRTRYHVWSWTINIVSLGAVGIRDIGLSVLGPSVEHVPALLWMVPWLIIWDIWNAIDAASIIPQAK